MLEFSDFEWDSFKYAGIRSWIGICDDGEIQQLEEVIGW